MMEMQPKQIVFYFIATNHKLPNTGPPLGHNCLQPKNSLQIGNMISEQYLKNIGRQRATYS